MVTMRNRGSILVAVLFLSAVLGVFAAVATASLHAGTDASRGFAEALRTAEAMRGAIEHIAGSSGSGGLPRSGTTKIALGETSVVVTFRDEIARIDLNHAAPELLAGIFRSVGVEAALAQRYAARIAAWRNPEDRGGAERNAYRAAGRIDGPRNGPFLHVAELALVLGIAPRVAAAVAPYVTVASGDERINPLLADPPVLLAIPGMNQDRVLNFLQDRQFRNLAPKDQIARLGPIDDYVTDGQSQAVRLEGRVRFGGRNDRPFEVVVAVLPGDSEPFRILAWDANPPERVRHLQ
jgi:general secretion pathway protein K